VIHILWPKPYADEIVRRFRDTLETGEPYQEPEWSQRRLDRKVVEYYEWRIDRIQLAEGCFGVVCYFQDISTHVTARERLKLLIDELNHRVKNTLAAVQSIAMQTLRDAPTTAEGWEALQARLLALASAHDVLTRGHWEGADIYELIQGSLAAYRTNGQEARLNVDGPNIHLLPRAVLALSMALHELATNAAKYGALSNGSGRVDVDWKVTVDPPAFSFRWAESGGPPVQMPRKRGFGSRLIERGLAQDLNGNIRLEFATAGVICTIAAPIDEVSEGWMRVS
jgi:two-component sensor histidine kinase